MLPLGCAAVAKSDCTVDQADRSCMGWDCCAVQREQAPSPQKGCIAPDYRPLPPSSPCLAASEKPLPLLPGHSRGARPPISANFPHRRPALLPLKHRCPCGEGACSRSAAQQSQNLTARCIRRTAGGGGWDCCAVQREQAPSPQKGCIAPDYRPLPPSPPCLAASETPLSLWRGSLLPLGCAAVAEPDCAVHQADCGCMGLGLLRSPAGASSLATEGVHRPGLSPTSAITALSAASETPLPLWRGSLRGFCDRSSRSPLHFFPHGQPPSKL
ncbi:hypothetical protein QE391_000222 [Pseudomonas fluorescens]|nr:hypothetical protein [Pseudomonas fluorescens]